VSLPDPRATEEDMSGGRASVRHLRRARLRELLEIGLAVCFRLAAHLGRQPGAIKQLVATPRSTNKIWPASTGKCAGSP
jgi:hypothetical protein